MTLLTADCTNQLRLTGHTDQPGTIEIWFPSDASTPDVQGDGLTNVHVTAVPGGWSVTAQVAGDYTVTGSEDGPTTSATSSS